MSTITTFMIFLFSMTVVLGLTFVVVFLGTLIESLTMDDGGKPNWNFLIIGVGILLTLWIGFQFGNQKAISNASLNGVYDDGYEISFNGEVHFYDWD